jgi:ribose 5-phosphate isomerase B
MKKVVVALDVPATGELRVKVGTIVTPAARDVAHSRGVRIVEVPDDQLPAAPAGNTVAIGADHGGFRLKETLKPLLKALDLEIRDVGVHADVAADYPDLAHQVAELVASGVVGRGVMIDGAGIGSSIAANRCPAFARPCAMIKRPLEIAGNTMILMCLRWVRGY